MLSCSRVRGQLIRLLITLRFTCIYDSRGVSENSLVVNLVSYGTSALAQDIVVIISYSLKMSHALMTLVYILQAYSSLRLLDGEHHTWLIRWLRV